MYQWRLRGRMVQAGSGQAEGLRSLHGALGKGTSGMQPRYGNYKETTAKQGRVFECPQKTEFETLR